MVSQSEHLILDLQQNLGKPQITHADMEWKFNLKNIFILNSKIW